MSSVEGQPLWKGASDHDELERLVARVTDQLAAVPAGAAPLAAVQHLLTTAVKSYVALREQGHDFGPFVHEDIVTATEVMVATSNMLHSADVELFELGMWLAREG